MLAFVIVVGSIIIATLIAAVLILVATLNRMSSTTKAIQQFSGDLMAMQERLVLMRMSSEITRETKTAAGAATIQGLAKLSQTLASAKKPSTASTADIPAAAAVPLSPSLDTSREVSMRVGPAKS